MKSLNPCCNGRGSRTKYKRRTGSTKHVLILVVMEEGLVPAIRQVAMGAAAS